MVDGVTTLLDNADVPNLADWPQRNGCGRHENLNFFSISYNHSFSFINVLYIYNCENSEFPADKIQNWAKFSKINKIVVSRYQQRTYDDGGGPAERNPLTSKELRRFVSGRELESNQHLRACILLEPCQRGSIRCHRNRSRIGADGRSTGDQTSLQARDALP